MPSAFLHTRTPPAPAPLAERLDGVPMGTGAPAEALLKAGLSELDACRSKPGRVRASAFHLLAADALITYACEAALGEEDPGSALLEILRQAGAPRR